MDGILTAKAVAMLLLPPAGNFLLFFLGWVVARRWRLGGNLLMVPSLGTLFVLSQPVTSHLLLSRWETVPPLPVQGRPALEPGAIVVLGGGRYQAAPEFGDDTVSIATLERLRYASRLYRRTGVPLLVSGGSVFGESLSEAFLMKEVLVDDFQVPVAWMEQESRNTRENAFHSAVILGREGIARIYLVTHAMHMPRSLEAFRSTGLEVVPAPMGYGSRGVYDFDWRHLVPTAAALYRNSLTLHEYLGVIWYRLRY